MFDRIWTNIMIKHHKGAVSTAKAEQTTGLYDDAVALAKNIETTRTAKSAQCSRCWAGCSPADRVLREAGAEETRRLPHLRVCLLTPSTAIPLGGIVLAAAR